MVNKINNNLPLVLAHKPDMPVIQTNSGYDIPAQRRNDMVFIEKKTPNAAAKFSEKGRIIDIYI